MMRKGIFIFSILLSTVSLFAQQGSIQGTVLDHVSGEPLVGATVVHDATGQKTITDFDGNFSFENIEEGMNGIKISYVSYSEAKLNRVIVNDGEQTSLKIKMSKVQSKHSTSNYLADKKRPGSLS